MKRSKKGIKYKIKKNKDVMMTIFEYLHATMDKDTLRYRLLQSIGKGRWILFQLDTTLLSGYGQTDGKEVIDQMIDTLETYQIPYIVNCGTQNVPKVGIQKLFSMQQTEEGVVYKLEFVVAPDTFTRELYDLLIAQRDIRMEVCNEAVDIEAVMALYRNGRIIEYDVTELFYADIYANKDLEQVVMYSRHISADHLQDDLIQIEQPL